MTIFGSHAGNLTEEGLEQVTVVSEPEDELCDSVMERLQLITSALQKDLPIASASVMVLRLTVS